MTCYYKFMLLHFTALHSTPAPVLWAIVPEGRMLPLSVRALTYP